MIAVFRDIVPWYVAVQLCTVAVLPLSLRFFRDLPDRGYASAKILGIFLVGLILWLGTSYGLLRNEFGGAMFALGILAAVSYGFGGIRALRESWNDSHSAPHNRIWYIVSVEGLFLVAFVVWTIVRAYDPAANHTEQPMDLMFMNSIWTSPAYPPKDAWFAGYPISYYYFGYWLLTTLGHLSSTPPAIAYNVGQASWYALLLTTGYGLGFDLFALYGQAGQGSAVGDGGESRPRRVLGPSMAAGGFTALFIGVIGNLQVVLEWLYARGADLSRLATWLGVNGFPTNAQQSGKWYIGYDWWWWRSSRVLSDQDLLGNHIEVIDEFPMFSYVLGDNHPHVLAMPVVIVVIAMALSLYLAALRAKPVASEGRRFSAAWTNLLHAVPMGLGGLLLIALVSGGLVFMNTWDYPPYWLLLVGSLFVGARTSVVRRAGQEIATLALSSAMLGIALVIATIAIYLPYFLTAQSQAGGFVPNLFNPTRLQQALLMFGVFLPAVIGLLVWGWKEARPSAMAILGSVAFVVGIPAFLLALSAFLVTSTGWGNALLASMPTPEEASASHLVYMVGRWTSRPYTFLLFGLALAACAGIGWSFLRSHELTERQRVLLFVLLVSGVGILLVYVPEFVYLRDNFGTRMNTVFKFYYQAWLLLAVSSSFAVTAALFAPRKSIPLVVRALGVLTLVAALGAMLFPFAGVYSKTGGFGSDAPTLDATAYINGQNPAEPVAIAWLAANTEPGDVVLEAAGASYDSSSSRFSATTGRATLLGWEGHERQWRGDAYGPMATGRSEALQRIYTSARAEEIPTMLNDWGIDYVIVGPRERTFYGVSPRSEERLAEAMDLVYQDGNVAIYRRR
ncbi:MAG: DUF2298 domain-containing protein [Caldilineaceae bacterium]